MTTSFSFHDKISDKFLILRSADETLKENVVLIFGKQGGRVITFEELADVSNLPEDFVKACKGANGAGIVSIDFVETTSVTGLQAQPGATDTYKIKMSDGTSSTYKLYNGLRVEDTMTVDQINTLVGNTAVAIVGDAPEALDTIAKLAAVFGNNPDAFAALVAEVNTKATKTTVDGMLDIPQVYKTEPYTVQLGDRGKSIDTTSNITIPPNSSVNFPIGTVIGFTNLSATNITVTPDTDVSLIHGGTTNTGARRLTAYAVGTIRKTGTNTWFITGSGII